MNGKQINVRAIEVGFGTTSYVSSIATNGEPVIETFTSSVSKVTSSSGDLGAGISLRNTTKVQVGSNYYEIGPDAGLLSAKISSRVLNNDYIKSEQYKALLFGCISMLDVDEVDLLVLGLPVSNYTRRNELIELAKGRHEFEGRSILIKNVWVIVQPLGGLLNYSQTIGQEKFSQLKDKNILSVDPGYGTFDWLLSRGLVINETRSGAADFGMSRIINSISDRLKPIFKGLGALNQEQIDEAFWKHKKFIRIAGVEYPFPKCEGKDINNENVPIKFDFTQDIRADIQSAMTELKNSVGDGGDIDLINLMGGPAPVYKDALKETFPFHKINILDNSIQSVCNGLYWGGIFYASKHL